MVKCFEQGEKLQLFYGIGWGVAYGVGKDTGTFAKTGVFAWKGGGSEGGKAPKP